MKLFTTAILLTLLFLMSACARSLSKSQSAISDASTSVPMSPPVGVVAGRSADEQDRAEPVKTSSSWAESERSNQISESSHQKPTDQTINRKIIRNAELRFETDSPSQSQQKITGIAETHGGYVVLSETSQNENRSQPGTMATLVLRIPSAQFTKVLEEIIGVGDRVLHQKISGKDVTEEFIDLEAQLRAKRALETQFLEIMKQSRKVSDALEVQGQLSQVRTEIERLDGRRRYLENQTEFSTITISLFTTTPVIAATKQGFWSDLKFAFSDGLDGALSFVLGLIRVVIFCLPAALLIALPAWILLRRFLPRSLWSGRPTATPPAES